MAKSNVDIVRGGKRYMMVSARTGKVESSLIVARGKNADSDVSVDVPEGSVLVDCHFANTPIGKFALDLEISQDSKDKIKRAIDRYGKGKAEKLVPETLPLEIAKDSE